MGSGVLHNLSQSCYAAITKIPKYFSSFDSIMAERDFYIQSFGYGQYNELITDSAFQHKMLKCLKVSGEKEYSKSEYPLSYCYGYDSNDKVAEKTVFTICIPTVCEHRDNILVSLFQLFLLNSYKNNIRSKSPSNRSDPIEIDESLCIGSRHVKEWYQKAVPLVSFLIILSLIFIVTLATVCDYQRCNGSTAQSVLMEIFLSFSLKRTLPKLFRMPKADNNKKSNNNSMITCMFGIRFLTIVWIVIGHSFAWIECYFLQQLPDENCTCANKTFQPYLANPHEYREAIAKSFLNQWISNFLLTVDTFLVLGGTVNAYAFFRKINSSGEDARPTLFSCGYWLRFYRHRVIRLWPAYLYTLLGVMFMTNLHFHGMWPPLDPYVQCAGQWWQNLLFVSSFFENSCMGWTWYISTEFMFYLVSPIFLLAFLRSARCGFSVSLSAIALSSVLRACAMWAYNLPPTQLGWNRPPIFNRNFMEHFTEMYIKPQYRIGPYIIGLTLGYGLANKDKFGLDCIDRKYLIVLWTSSICCGVASVFGLYPILQDWLWPGYYLLYGAVHRCAYAVSVAWILFACHCGYAKWVNTFLSFRVFIPLSNLSYSVYLSHMPVIFATYLQLKFPHEYRGVVSMLIPQCFVRLLMAYVLGLQCALLSEMPAINIEKILLLTRRNSDDKNENAGGDKKGENDTDQLNLSTLKPLNHNHNDS
ncbi:unnamed protein product [Anisakis simplex]|uniref:Acyl_transf_3 domain-containing protein n=1 Tax=Anisakis simplex TaxID=6269 RepID=A0A0M3JXL4_ANISI|nr:unnamed protein product [Anisakis simplex]